MALAVWVVGLGGCSSAPEIPPWAAAVAAGSGLFALVLLGIPGLDRVSAPQSFSPVNGRRAQLFAVFLAFALAFVLV